MSAEPVFPGYRSFEFDLPPALLSQLLSVLGDMERGSLSHDHVTAVVPEAQGIYQLFHNDQLVYIGKTDAESGLRRRLQRHAFTILSRHNLDVARMSFKAVRVLVFSAMDLETALIRHYRDNGSATVWNGSGFGNNDPGRQRDLTALRSDGFDANYPINIDLPIEIGHVEGPVSTLNFLARVAGLLPYTLRHEKTPAALDLLRRTLLTLPAATITMRDLMILVIGALPPGWQATKLSGRVILYKERQDHYPGGQVIARS
jgi:hypothetical protein